MPEYTIYYNTMASQPITVTADDLDQAIDAGYDLLSSGLCHQCAGPSPSLYGARHTATDAAPHTTHRATTGPMSCVDWPANGSGGQKRRG